MGGLKLDPQDLREAQYVMLKMLKEVDHICCENHLSYWLDFGSLLGAVRHQGFIPWDDDADISMMRDDYEKFIKIAPTLLPKDMFLQNLYTDKFTLWNYIRIRDNNSLALTDEPLLCHQGLSIDIFPIDKLSTKKWVRHFWRKVIKRIYIGCSTFIKYRQRRLKSPFFSYRNLIRNFLILITKLFGNPSFPNKRVAASIEKKLRKFAIIQSEETDKFVLGYGICLPFKFTFSYQTVFPLQKLTFEDMKFYVPNDWDKYLRTLYGDYMQLPKEEDRTQHAVKIIPHLDSTDKEYSFMNWVPKNESKERIEF